MRSLWIGCAVLLVTGCAGSPEESGTEEEVFVDAGEVLERAGNNGGGPNPNNPNRGSNNGGRPGSNNPNGGGGPPLPALPPEFPANEPPELQNVRNLLRLPESFPVPIIPESNPLTAEKIELGRHLFYDQRLSVNRQQSCASCHQQSFAFADNRRLPRGTTGETLRRNSQGLTNVAYFQTLTWAHHELLDLEAQLLIPLQSDSPVELGLTPAFESQILERLRDDADYPLWFAEAFPNDPEIRVETISQALSSFVRSLISTNSSVDRFRQGDTTALTPQQQEGMRLFQSRRFGCTQCHGGLNLTVSYQDALTPPAPDSSPFFNIGLYNVDGQGSYPANDQGIHDLTGNPQDRGRFRVSSLRNVAVTAPYMHDGSLQTLRDVLRHYTNAGTITIEGPNAGNGRVSPLKSELVRPIRTNREEVDAVVSFLEGLTDPDFLTNPRQSNPWPSEHPAQGFLN